MSTVLAFLLRTGATRNPGVLHHSPGRKSDLKSARRLCILMYTLLDVLVLWQFRPANRSQQPQLEADWPCKLRTRRAAGFDCSSLPDLDVSYVAVSVAAHKMKQNERQFCAPPDAETRGRITSYDLGPSTECFHFVDPNRLHSRIDNLQVASCQRLGTAATKLAPTKCRNPRAPAVIDRRSRSCDRQKAPGGRGSRRALYR